MDLLTSAPGWVLARATGAVLLVLLTAVTALGLATASGLRAAGVPRFAVQLLHRNAALLAVVLLATHVALVVVDPYVDVGPLAAVVPLASGYAPVAVGLGALALDLLLAVVVTSLLRVRLGLRAWRAVHLLAYAAWPLALVHGLAAGTDGTAPWMLAVDAACVVLLTAALAVRLRARAERAAALPPSRTTQPAARPTSPVGAPR